MGKLRQSGRDVKLRMKLEVIADVRGAGLNDCQEKNFPQK
jgi:hypothetical protein